MLSGYVTTRLLVPSFISPLAVGGIAFSLAQYLSGQRALNMDAMQRDAVFSWMIGKTGIIPNELFIGAALLALALFVERRTTLGRALKAVGAGEPVLALTGGRGADLVIESVGSAVLCATAQTLIRKGGHIGLFGLIGPDQVLAVNILRTVLEENSLKGSVAGMGEDMHDALVLLSHGRFRTDAFTQATFWAGADSNRV